MVDKGRMTLHKLARWHPSQSNASHDRKIATGLWEGTLQPIEHEDLKQGALYIIKIHHVSVGLFQGWNDDMCCFAVLRSENTPMRWSQARYLPGDFDAFDAFDEAGNPPVHLWTRYLRVDVPINWFTIFEEARRKQREWTAQVLGHQHPPVVHHHHTVPITSAQTIATGAAAAAAAHNNSNNNNMIIGAGYPMMNKSYHSHNNHNNIHNNNNNHNIDDDFTDHETYSAVASQSLRSTRLSSISSLPLDSRPVGVASLSENYSPPQSPTSDRLPSLNNTVNQFHSFSSSSDPNTKKEQLKKEELNKDDEEKEKEKIESPSSIQTKNVHHIKPFMAEMKSNTSSSSTTVLQQQQQQQHMVTPTQKLAMALEDISFPHDDDQFSIHSDYEMNIKKQLPSSDQLSHHSKQSASNTMWRKPSIKKMLRRYSNPSSANK